MQIDNLILDGTNIEFRIFYVTRNLEEVNENGELVKVKGEQSNCTFKFLQTFNKLVEKFNPTNIYASWDKKITWPSTNFRKDILGDKYKAGRTKPHDIQEMYDQEIKLIEMLESLGVKSIYPNVLEADDVCAWLATTLPGHNIIVSVDQDLLQLVSPQTSVYNLKELITYENFEEKTGIKPEFYKLFKAIKGDPSDNIIGLEGYGEVRSRKLAINWNNTILTEEYRQKVEQNLKLIDLQYGYNHQLGEKQKYEEQLNYVKNIKANIEKFMQLCAQNQFITYIKNIDKWKQLINRNRIIEIINNL